MKKKLQSKKQVNIRLNNPKNLDIFTEWEVLFEGNENKDSKNKRLEQILMNGITQELTNNKVDYFEEKFQDLFEKNTNMILKRVFGRQDLITMNIIKYLKIDELKSNFLLNQLYEIGSIKENYLIDPHRQQLADSPWVLKEKNNLDSEFAHLQKTEIIKDFASIGKDSMILQSEIEDDINRSIDELKKSETIQKYAKKINKERRKKNDN